MKTIRIITALLIVTGFGLYFGMETRAQNPDQTATIERANLQFYQNRETAASPEIRADLRGLRELIRDKKFTFQVGYTHAMDYPVEQLTGLVVPPDLDEQINRQNGIADRKMQALRSAGVLRGCSADARYFDWRRSNGVTDVRDQGACGSCWDFATCGAYEGGYRVQFSLALDCSEQHILDCNPWGYSCSGGWWAFQFFVDNGVADESGYPYRAVRGACNTSVAVPNKAVTWGYVDSRSGVPAVSSIKQALCEHGPLAVAVLVTPAFRAYTSGVLNETANAWTRLSHRGVNELVKPANQMIYRCVRAGRTGVIQPNWPVHTGETVIDGDVIWSNLGLVNHGVTLIGWNDSTGAWLIKNSWGKNWGDACGTGNDRGYIWISYGTDNIGYAAAWVLPIKRCAGCCCR
jgi:cathepsin L